MLVGGRGISSTGPCGRRTHEHADWSRGHSRRPADVRLLGVCHRGVMAGIAVPGGGARRRWVGVVGRWSAGAGHPVPDGAPCGSCAGGGLARLGPRGPRAPARLLRASAPCEYDGRVARRCRLVDGSARPVPHYLGGAGTVHGASDGQEPDAAPRGRQADGANGARPSGHARVRAAPPGRRTYRRNHRSSARR